MLNLTVADVNYFIVRTRPEAIVQLTEFTRAIETQDPFVQVLSAHPMTALVADSIGEECFRGWVSGLFGATALVLAATGLYGFAARFVSERRREIGIRRALGARPADVRRFVFRDAAWIVGAGLAAGLPGAYAASRSAEAYVYGLSASDPTTLALSATVLMATALLACVFPARRAAALAP